MSGEYLDRTLILWSMDYYRAGAVFNSCPTGCWQSRTRPRGYSLTLKLIWCALMPGRAVVNYPPASAGDAHSIPGSGRSPGVGNGNPLLYSFLGNSMDRGAWWATAHGRSQRAGHDWAHSTQCKESALAVTGGWLHQKSHHPQGTCNGFSCSAHSKENFQAGTQLRTSSSQALSHQEVLDPKCQPQRLGSLAVWQTAWKVNSARVNAYVMNSLQRTCFTVPEMCYMGRTNFKSLWIVGEKCLVQGVTEIRFLSDPFELLDFLSAAFKWCLGINWANMRHRLLLWKQRGNSDYLVFWVKESYMDILILEI